MTAVTVPMARRVSYRPLWLAAIWLVLLAAPYWDEGEYGALQPPIERFLSIARTIQSRFFTMDVAKQQDGDWLIVELGDGQVAGLPERADVRAFYRVLAERIGA